MGDWAFGWIAKVEAERDDALTRLETAEQRAQTAEEVVGLVRLMTLSGGGLDISPGMIRRLHEALRLHDEAVRRDQ